MAKVVFAIAKMLILTVFLSKLSNRGIILPKQRAKFVLLLHKAF